MAKTGTPFPGLAWLLNQGEVRRDAMKKPVKKEYPLQLIAKEWSKLFDAEITEDDILTYGADGELILNLRIYGKKFNVENFSGEDQDKVMAFPAGDTVLNMRYIPISCAFIEKLLYNSPHSPAQINEITFPNAKVIPDGGVLDIRREDIFVLLADKIAFEKKYITKEPDKAGNPLTTTERTTLLVIIAALCKNSGIDYKDRGCARKIANMTDEIGAPVSDDAILKKLKEIENALESRVK
jgi:hypothetical protein